MAVLKDLKLIHPTANNIRTYESLASDAFMDEVKALMDSSIDLSNTSQPTPTQSPKKGTLKLKPSNAKDGTTRVTVRG